MGLHYEKIWKLRIDVVEQCVCVWQDGRVRIALMETCKNPHVDNEKPKCCQKCATSPLIWLENIPHNPQLSIWPSTTIF